MKNFINYGGFLIITCLLSNLSFAQDATQRQTMDQSTMTDPGQSQRFMNDLNKRNPNTLNQNIEWVDNKDGHYGNYTLDSVIYMTRYDKKGNFQGTYAKKDWNDESVPVSLKTSFDRSTYRGSAVSSYWESTEPNNKTYYMELRNDKGKSSNVWANDRGKFSTTPYSQTPVTPNK